MHSNLNQYFLAYQEMPFKALLVFSIPRSAYSDVENLSSYTYMPGLPRHTVIVHLA